MSKSKKLAPFLSEPNRVDAAVKLASVLQQRANELQTPSEKRQQAELDRMIQMPADKATLTLMTDQAFRAKSPHRVADQLIHILDVQGVPRFFSPIDRSLLKGFQSFGNVLPGVSVPMVKRHMHQETANVILPAEPDLLQDHLNARRDEGLRMNVNILGEALLGEDEAMRRITSTIETLKLPAVEVMSIKISTIYSQISPVARAQSVDLLCRRLERLYRAAARERFIRADGTEVPKFLYLDMEEYRDMEITAEVFMRTLDELPECSAGIVLQAYIPDSFRMQQRLLDWARTRVTGGGAPVVLRIVKGANMEMERFEASLHGWPQAPYDQKIDTDANYKKMLHLGMQPENLAAMRLGIATHNLFEISYALILAAEHEALDQVQFEMLEGMANHLRRALFEQIDDLLLYAPACRHEHFIHAIGYLVRRLDENTGEENFLRHAFKLEVGSEDWNQLEAGFRASCDHITNVSDAPRRTQDRHDAPSPLAPEAAFESEADTDFSLVQNGIWANGILDHWSSDIDTVPIVFGGEAITERDTLPLFDPSKPGDPIAHACIATPNDIQAAVACAIADDDGWRNTSAAERATLLGKVAQEFRKLRGDLMGHALVETGKILTQSDPEVSEAIDFLEYYGRSATELANTPQLELHGLGVIAVISPWNFPIAIPCGGIAAALAAGNHVLLKPAEESVRTAYALCQCFWNAGVSRKVLQFVPGPGAVTGAALAGHEDVSGVIFTGGTETARKMLDARPTMNLMAETGGKNAMIVTALADRDLAVKNAIYSAFGHSGQKCSATSLLILEQEVFEDEAFRTALVDAAKSMKVGPARDATTKLGPLIREPSGPLERAFKELEPGETWALMPQQLGDNPHLWSPGIKWGVQPGGFTHTTEFFGPVLGVMSARNLDEAIRFANSTGYGLTAGLQSLDDREQDIWLERMRAGNLYINRSTTGAIVRRQPFGGFANSAFGMGIKAGGPNYVLQLCDARCTGFENDGALEDVVLGSLVDPIWWPGCDDELGPIRLAFDHCETAFADVFSQQLDQERLIGQDNFRRYLPVRDVRICVHPDDSMFEVLVRIGAARIAGCRITLSSGPEVPSDRIERLMKSTADWGGAIEFVEEDEADLLAIIEHHETDRLRYAAPERVPIAVRRAVPLAGCTLVDRPVTGHGRLEVLWMMEEQSISIDYHRYGNLGARNAEPRSELLQPR